MGVLYAKKIICLTCDTSIFLVEEVKYQAERLKLWRFTGVAICCGQLFNHPVTKIVIPSLILTCSPLKINGWKMYFLFGARPIFRGELLVFRECTLPRKSTKQAVTPCVFSLHKNTSFEVISLSHFPFKTSEKKPNKGKQIHPKN